VRRGHGGTGMLVEEFFPQPVEAWAKR